MPQDGKKARSAVHALFDGESILLLQSSSAFTIAQDPNPAQRRRGNHADGSNVTITQSPDATQRRGESHADGPEVLREPTQRDVASGELAHSDTSSDTTSEANEPEGVDWSDCV